MAKFNRVHAYAVLGAGETNEEAVANINRRLSALAASENAGEANDDVGIQRLYRGDPGGGGPCRPQKLDVAEVILTVPLPEAKNNDDDD